MTALWLFVVALDYGSRDHHRDSLRVDEKVRPIVRSLTGVAVAEYEYSSVVSAFVMPQLSALIETVAEAWLFD